jgi:hypothetical protein
MLKKIAGEVSHLYRGIKNQKTLLVTKYDNWVEDKKPQVIHFACSVGGYYVSSPIQLARSIIPQWMKDQVRGKGEGKCPMGFGETDEAAKKAKPAKFVRCPGMHDFLQQGFIVSAAVDIHITATRHSVNVDTPHAMQELLPKPMDLEIIDGIAPVRGTEPNVWKVSLPWGVHMPEGYSAHVMPAFFHFPFFDKLFVYPGTVDYDGFHTINFIFTVLDECELVIPQGTPLLQVLPFKRQDFHATSAAATQLQKDRHQFGMSSRIMGFYRRTFYRKKTYTIEVTK